MLISRIIFTGILVIGFFGIAVCANAEKKASIIVKEAKAYGTPSSFGKVVATLKYTNPVTILEEKSGWLKVTFAGNKQGWIHSSAVSSGNTTIAAGSSDKNTGASSDEVALAGKGFNKEVEAKYKKDNAKIDYSWIDRMEGYKVTPDQIIDFLTQGKLNADGGAE